MQTEPGAIISKLVEPLGIGPVALPNRVFLAPMSGVSDRPFRSLAHSLGAGMVVSEMVAGEFLAVGDEEATLRAERAGDGPHVVQLAGREARWMGEGARAATDAGADIIDINMGCPARKVTNGYSGSALMRDLDHALTLIEATVSATDVPVTLKMRLGWDENTLNAPELARRAEAAGVRMVTVHGRTRCQFYNGTADWLAIRAVKDAVSIPVVANGDLVRPDDLGTMLDLSGADAVMVGRGAYGRPWVPGHLAAFARTGEMPEAPTGADLADLVAGHYEAMIDHYGERNGVRCARKHLGWYLEGAGIARTRRGALMSEERPAAVMRLILQVFADEGTRIAA
jgi:nifR3 family TIM-barrel protein